MLKNYLKTAFRNILRHKGYSAINIFGLAIGLTCVTVIMLFVQDERSYDRFHEKQDRIYRVIAKFSGSNQTQIWAVGEHKRAPLLKADFPDAEEIVRLGIVAPPVQYEDKVFQEKNFFIADPEITNVFSLPFVKGDARSALREPNTVVVNETTAQKYFGSSDPMGKVITILDTVKLKVTGVIRDMPRASHFHADFICSMGTDRSIYSEIVFKNWGELSVYTYMLFPQKIDPVQMNGRLAEFIRKNMDAETAKSVSYELQPLTDIHFENWQGEIETNSDRSYLYIFSCIALATLLIAGINYMNLSTARASLRAKEVGIRKAVGAERKHLIRQFLSESMLMSFLALLLALLFTEMLLPAFNSLAGRTLSLSDAAVPELVMFLFFIMIGIGLIAGAYPAFVLSAFNPISVLKGSLSKSGGAVIRKIFATFQFTVSVALIVSALVIFGQIKYLHERPLGYSAEQVVMIPMPSDAVLANFESIKNDWLRIPGVRSISKTSKMLGGRLSSNLGFVSENVPEGMTAMQGVVVDHDFFKTLGIPIVEGRDFSREFSTDAEEGIIINEAAVRAIGWTSALGKPWKTWTLTEKGTWTEKNGRIIGVVKDFHYEPLYQKIVPIQFYLSPNWSGIFVIKIADTNIPQRLEAMHQVWKRYAPVQPYEPKFLDERLQALYRSQERFGTLIGYFAVLAILIACLGLFGLASFTAEQRTKEIGIRKVLGASVPEIVFLLAREFVALVMLAILLASPAAYFIMNQWLSNFAYRIDIGIGVFILAGLAAILIALLTVMYRSIKAATANPVDALKYE